MLGATGMLGRPVAVRLLREGFPLTVMSRKPATIVGLEGARRARGDVFDTDSLRSSFTGHDIVYLNLRQGASPSAPQPETDGLRNVIAAAREAGVRRIAMISSLVQNYEGMNGFHWWAFETKREALAILRDSGLEWTIFYPSSFMDNFLSSYREGASVMLAGTGKHPQWFIDGDDYGRQVARSFEMESAARRDYPVQGPEPLLPDRAAEIFVEHYTAEPLRIKRTPLWPLRLAGLVKPGLRDLWSIIEALNKYPERFQSETTWRELGKPETTLVAFARRASQEFGKHSSS